MNRLIAIIGTAILLVGFNATQAGAVDRGGKGLRCFDGASEGVGNGVCTAHRDGSFTLKNPAPGDYSGVYAENQNVAGKLIKNTTLKYTYSGTIGGGSPRISIPLGGGDYAYLDAACDANNDKTVNIKEAGCIISDSQGYYGLVANYNKVAGSGYTFIVADQPGTVKISNIDLMVAGR